MEQVFQIEQELDRILKLREILEIQIKEFEFILGNFEEISGRLLKSSLEQYHKNLFLDIKNELYDKHENIKTEISRLAKTFQRLSKRRMRLKTKIEQKNS